MPQLKGDMVAANAGPVEQFGVGQIAHIAVEHHVGDFERVFQYRGTVHGKTLE